MADEIKFYGISETLFYLKEYEKDLYTALRKDLVEKATPLAQLVGSKFPDEPLRNWHSSGDRIGKARLPPYMGAKAQSSVKPKAGTGSVRGGTRGSVILRIQQMDGGGQIYDSAGRGNYETSGSTFIDNLDRKSTSKSNRGRTRSRILFGAVKGNQAMIEQDVLEVVTKINNYTTKAINAKRGN